MNRLYLIMVAVTLCACGAKQNSNAEVLPEGKVRLRVDDGMINRGDLEAIMLPMGWWIAVHGSNEEYEYEMRRISKGQRMLYAAATYVDDARKEGHQAYFRLAAPKAVDDAVEGLRMMGMGDHAAILERAIEKKTGKALEDADLDDEDVELLELNEKVDVHEQMLRYVRSNRADFYYNEIVNKP